MTCYPRVPCIRISKLLFFGLLKELGGCHLPLDVFIDSSLDIFLLIFVKMPNDPVSPDIDISELLFNLLQIPRSIRRILALSSIRHRGIIIVLNAAPSCA